MLYFFYIKRSELNEVYVVSDMRKFSVLHDAVLMIMCLPVSIVMYNTKGKYYSIVFTSMALAYISYSVIVILNVN